MTQRLLKEKEGELIPETFDARSEMQSPGDTNMNENETHKIKNVNHKKSNVNNCNLYFY